MKYSARQPPVEVVCGACETQLTRAAWLVRKHSMFFCDAACRRKGQPTPRRTSKLEVGSTRVNGEGYRLVFLGYGAEGTYGATGYALEHRMVMREVLGRALLPTESVHHLNGDRLDNRAGNLELWVGVGAQPRGVRVSDAVAHARAILAFYGDADEQKKYEGDNMTPWNDRRMLVPPTSKPASPLHQPGGMKQPSEHQPAVKPPAASKKPPVVKKPAPGKKLGSVKGKL